MTTAKAVRYLGVWLASCAPLLAVLGGCRAVLGIDELELASDAGDGAARDAPSDVLDAQAADTGADAPVTSSCARAADCPKCCREDVSLRDGFGRLERLAADAGCICGAAPCQQECSPGSCAAPGGGPSTPTCGGCVDMQSRPPSGSAPCTTAKARCAADLQGCKPALDCITSCR